MWRTPEGAAGSAGSSRRAGPTRRPRRVARQPGTAWTSAAALRGAQASDSFAPSAPGVEEPASPNEAWLEVFEEEVRDRELRKAADDVLVGAVLEDLRKYVDLIEKDKWMFEDVNGLL